jgi:hypothetical protein
VVSVKVNLSNDEARGLADQLAKVLRTERPVDVISGKETERRLPSEGVPSECVAKAPCRTDLGRRLDADELLMLVIVKMGDRIQIDATWADVASGRVISRPQMVIEPKADRTKVFTEAVPLLLPHIKKQTKKGPDIVIVPTGTSAPSNGRHFTTATWIATGVAAASLIGGGIFALSASRKFSSLEDDNCRNVGCDASEIDSLRSRALAADMLFTVAAASTVTALVFYLRSAKGSRAAESPSPKPGVRVGIGPTGVTIGGAF